MCPDVWPNGVLVRRYFKPKNGDRAQRNNLSICSFNCRLLKSSLVEVHELCDRYDIILQQEHLVVTKRVKLSEQCSL